MANQPRFEVEDIERLFRALIPDATENPFGEIREALSSLAERFEEEILATDAYREEADDDRAAIKSRTFGILLLQIFKTLKIFFSFLPQARVILIVIAIIGLASTLLEDKPVTLDAIRTAVQKTGIADFIDKILDELKKSVGEMAQELDDIADVISISIAQGAGRFERLEQLLANAQQDAKHVLAFFQNFTNQFSEGFETLAADSERSLLNLTRGLGGGLGTATVGANALSNIDVFLTPLLRSIPDELRAIPDLAGKLVRFT